MMVTVPTVIRTQDSRSIPGPLVTAYFFSACVWCLCGWILADPLITSPNVASALASATCLYLKATFPSDTADMKAAEIDESGVSKPYNDRCPNKPSKLVSTGVNECTPLTCDKKVLPEQVQYTSELSGDGTGGTC